VSELCALNREDVPLGELPTLIVRSGKGRKRRHIPLGDEDAMSSLEAIAVSDWPRPETDITTSVEVGGNRTDGSSLKRKLSEDAQGHGMR